MSYVISQSNSRQAKNYKFIKEIKRVISYSSKAEGLLSTAVSSKSFWHIATWHIT